MWEDFQEVNHAHKESVTDGYLNGSEVTGKEVISTEAITPMIVAGNLVNVQVEYVGVSQPTLNNAPQDQKKIPHEEAREITKTQTIHHTENTPTWKRLVHQTDSPMRVSNTISNNSGSKRGQPGIEMMKKRRGKKGRTEMKAMTTLSNGGGCGAAPPRIMKILSWNCRGLGNQRVVDVLSHIVREKTPKILFLVETQQSVDKMWKIQADLPYWCMLAVPSIHRSGGLALFWMEEIDLHSQTFTLHHIDALIFNGPNTS